MNLEYTRAPHRTHNDIAALHNAALLIDFDNVTMGIRSNLGQELRTLLDSEVIRGKVAVQRAYADWRRYPQYIVPLSESSIDLIFAPAYGSSKKNATDIRLAIDALELVFTRPEIGVFILLSGDSDFSSLVLKLKEYGKYVIGVGLQESTSDILVQNCDEYYSYNRLSGLTSADEGTSEQHDPWILVGKAITRMGRRGDVMRSDRLKQVMLELDPGFDEKTAGFSKFNRFLAEAAHRNLVRLRKGENGQYEVAPGEEADRESAAAGAVAEAPVESPSRSESRGRRGGRRGSRGDSRRGPSGSRRESGRPASAETKAPERTESEDSRAAPSIGDEAFAGSDPAVALRHAYDELALVVDDLYEEGEPIRDSMVKRKLLARDETFDEGSLGFRKFSRFLRQAHDEGIVDLSQGEDGNYYLKPVAGEDAHPSRRRSRPGPPAERREGGPDRKEAAPAAAGAAVPDRQAPGADREAPGADREEAGDDGSPLAAARAAAKRTLGRFRRGSRARSRTGGGASAGESRPRIGPIDEPSGDDGPDAAGAEDGAGAGATGGAAEGAATDVAPEAGPTAEEAASATDREGTEPRGLGRYRTGSRGRASTSSRSRSGGSSGASRIGPVAESELESSSDAEPSASPTRKAADERSEPRERPGPSRDGGDGAGRDAIDHMVRHYPGVGKRTAEALVDRFGTEVFDVIDSEPDRLTEVISEGRAQAVIDARREERAD